MAKNKIMNENTNRNISTKRMLMRPLTVGDIEEFYEIVKKNNVGKWLGIGSGMSFEESRQYVKKIIQHWNKYSFGVWAVVNKSTKAIMGHCGLRYLDDTNDIEIIYLLDPKYWGMGYATEAGNAAVNFAFNSLKINKLIERVRKNNIKSKQVIDSLDFSLFMIKIMRIVNYHTMN